MNAIPPPPATISPAGPATRPLDQGETLMPAARQSGTAGPAVAAPARAPASLRALSAGVGILGSEGVAAYFHLALGEALAAADAIVPLAIAFILITAVLRGSDQTCERVFRLLRWIANRPEPPPPPLPPADDVAPTAPWPGPGAASAAPVR